MRAASAKVERTWSQLTGVSSDVGDSLQVRQSIQRLPLGGNALDIAGVAR